MMVFNVDAVRKAEQLPANLHNMTGFGKSDQIVTLCISK